MSETSWAEDGSTRQAGVREDCLESQKAKFPSLWRKVAFGR